MHLFLIHIALIFAQHLIFIFSDKMKAGFIMVYLNYSGTHSFLNKVGQENMPVMSLNNCMPECSNHTYSKF